MKVQNEGKRETAGRFPNSEDSKQNGPNKQTAEQKNLKSAPTDRLQREQSRNRLGTKGNFSAPLNTKKSKRWIKEAIKIRRRGERHRGGEGAYTLLHTWDSLLQGPPEDCRWGTESKTGEVEWKKKTF